MAEKDNKIENVSNLVWFSLLLWLDYTFILDWRILSFRDFSNEIIRLSQNNWMQLFFSYSHNYILLNKNEIHLPEWNNW